MRCLGGWRCHGCWVGAGEPRSTRREQRWRREPPGQSPQTLRGHCHCPPPRGDQRGDPRCSTPGIPHRAGGSAGAGWGSTGEPQGAMGHPYTRERGTWGAGGGGCSLAPPGMPVLPGGAGWAPWAQPPAWCVWGGRGDRSGCWGAAPRMGLGRGPGSTPTSHMGLVRGRAQVPGHQRQRPAAPGMGTEGLGRAARAAAQTNPFRQGPRLAFSAGRRLAHMGAL